MFNYDEDHCLGYLGNISLRYVLVSIMKRRKGDISVKFRVWFFTKDEKLLGKGRVELLELIDEKGSISQAAKAMGMSYRQAWQMVQEMNERAGRLLVEKKLGGKSGGGAFVTENGRQLIASFKALEKRVAQFIAKELKGLNI